MKLRTNYPRRSTEDERNGRGMIRGQAEINYNSGTRFPPQNFVALLQGRIKNKDRTSERMKIR
jgi:hypothetical protein